MAEGDARGSCESQRVAWRLWLDAGAPYEAARTRLLLAEAYRAEGDEDAMRLELRAAQSTFERLGAESAATRAVEMLGAEAEPAPIGRVRKTFVFTDIVQSTALVEALGDAAWEHLLHWHDQTLRSVFAAHGGEEVKITHEGDGFFLAFDDSLAALSCAVDVQRTLAAHRRAHGFALHRMSVISYGESEPMVENDSRENRARNRRVLLVVLK